MQFLHGLSKDNREPVVVGLQKGGYVAEYMNLLQKSIPPNRLFSITDDFRYNYLGTEPSENGLDLKLIMGMILYLRLQAESYLFSHYHIHFPKQSSD